MKRRLTWVLNLIKTHFRKIVNAKLLPNDDLKVPNTKESVRTVSHIGNLSLAWPSLL